jgi:hypothetical protein
MSYIKPRTEFYSTNEDYFKGLSDTTVYRKKKQIDKQAKMADDDPEAYQEMPGDQKARREGKVKLSKHTKSYHELYGEEENESFSILSFDVFEKKIKIKEDDKTKDIKISKSDKEAGVEIEIEGDDDKVEVKESIINYELYAKLKGDIKIEKEIKSDFSNFELTEEEKATGDRSPIDNPDIEKALKKKSEETGVPIGHLRIVMRRGMAAWRTGHRPGAGQEQWGYARVNSFLTKQPGTWGRPLKDPKAKTGDAAGADADVAQEVIKGGHDSKLKKA